ncbi:hypothetical protein CPC197_0422, partial [Chlamydia psittaci C1/97]
MTCSLRRRSCIIGPRNPAALIFSG